MTKCKIWPPGHTFMMTKFGTRVVLPDFGCNPNGQVRIVFAELKSVALQRAESHKTFDVSLKDFSSDFRAVQV